MKRILVFLLVSGMAVAFHACGKKSDLEPPGQFRLAAMSAEL